MIPLRPGLPLLPKTMASLPRDERGYPVPWFVPWFTADGRPAEPGEGKPEFRAMDAGKWHAAVVSRLCWVCGHKLHKAGKPFAFVIGPMCAVNRISSEPPSHVSCAEFSARACPFLSLPKAQRREAHKPDGVRPAAGIPILRNPGVTLVWITERYELVPDQADGQLVRIGPARGVLWYTEGRQATRAEVLHSIETGLPLLREMAERDGADAIQMLEAQTTAAMRLLPAA